MVETHHLMPEHVTDKTCIMHSLENFPTHVRWTTNSPLKFTGHNVTYPVLMEACNVVYIYNQVSWSTPLWLWKTSFRFTVHGLCVSWSMVDGHLQVLPFKKSGHLWLLPSMGDGYLWGFFLCKVVTFGFDHLHMMVTFGFYHLHDGYLWVLPFMGDGYCWVLSFMGDC